MKPRRHAMSSNAMDRTIAKWFIYVAIGLGIAYLLMHFEEVHNAYSTLSADFWSRPAK